MKWRVTEYGWMNLAQVAFVVGITLIVTDGGWKTFLMAFFLSGALTMTEFMADHRARGYGINSFEKKL